MIIWYIMGVIDLIIGIFLISMVLDIDVELIATIITLILALVCPFFILSGALWVICWAFHFTWWSWKICIGIYAICLILKFVFGGSKK